MTEQNTDADVGEQADMGAKTPWNLVELVRAALVPLLSFAGGLAMLYWVLLEGPVGTLRWIDVGCGALACGALLFRAQARTA
ncbi:MAG: hypothetical protein ACRD0P_29820, partial [Stackebrandtia sp.]